MRQSNGTGLALLIGLICLGLVVIGLSVSVLMRIDPGGSQTDPSWNRVQSSSVLIVGTAADNPPFSYYDDSLQLTGLDVALASSLAARLELSARIADYAFEGLPEALRAGEIDVAIAAISVNPDRAMLVDFSDVYYLGSDGLLALAGAEPGSIRSSGDLSGKRVAVQRGSVYEDWLTDRLPRQSVLPYPRLEDAVTDLRSKRVDLVMLDLLPAEALAKDGSLTVVGRALNEQRYGIAVRRGSATLLARINRALAQARTDGELDRLVRQHLKVEPGQMLPQPTPGPVVTPRAGPPPAAPVGCTNSMFISESLGLTDPPSGAPPVVQPGQPFTKGWVLSNSGTCAWNAKYRLVYAQGNVPAARMGVETAPIGKDVPAGGSIDLSLDLAAPLTPGTYQAIWQLVDDKGVPFGQRPQVRVSVPTLPTPTAGPSPAPSQQTQLSADRARVRAGERVTLTWRVDGARTAYLYAAGERWQDSVVPATGQRDFYPQASTTYELRVVRDSGIELRQSRVDIDPAAGAPVIGTFSADPASLSSGQCVDITWEIRGDVTRVDLVGNGAMVWDGAPTAGMLRDCPAGPGNVEYRLEALGPGGSARSQKFVGVSRAPAPAGTPSPVGPTVAAFTVSPSRVQKGSCIGIAWSVSGADLVKIQRNGVVVLDNAAPSGQAQECPQLVGPVVYRIDVTSATGQSATREQSVQVTDGPPAAPPVTGGWRVTRLSDGQAMANPVPSSSLTVQFFDAGRIEGLAGCNSYSSRYTPDASSLRLTDLSYAATVCAAPPGIMQQETRFLDALRSVARYTLTSDTLSLQDASGRVLIELKQDRTLNP